MTYIPASGSVVTFQSNQSVLNATVHINNTAVDPVPVSPPASGSLPVTQVGSIITVSQGSIGAYIIGGSVAVSVTPPANQSVSGTVQVQQNGTWRPSIYSIIPGVGQTELGKAHGSIVGDGDTGVGVLAKIEYVASQSFDADGTYDTPSLTRWHELRTRDQRARDLANCNNASVFTAINNDTSTPVDSADHVFGTGAVSFDKLNGTDNTVYAGIEASLVALNITDIFEDGGFVGMSTKLPSLTNVVGNFLRIGKDSTNWNEWKWPASVLTANTWNTLKSPTSQPASFAGVGWNTASITYLSFGTEFSNQTNTLAGMIFDNVHFVGGRVTDNVQTTQINTNVNTANTNLFKVGGNITDTNSGTVGAGTLRVTQATDVPIKTLTSIQGNVSVSGTLNTNPSSVWVINPNQSVSGAVSVSNFPTTQNVSGSVVAFPTGQYTVVSSLAGGIFPISGSVGATITNTNLNVSGSVVAFQGGTRISSISGQVTVVSSLAGGIFPVSGSVSAVITNTPNVNTAGSVVAFQGAGWSGSVAAVQIGTRMTSVVSANPSSLLVGNYAQRNDAVASFLGGNLTWNPTATDSAGRILVKPFSSEDNTIISYTGSVVSGSVTLIQASAIGKRNYITDFWVANTGATTALVTFQGGDTSVVGYTIAPTGGGSNSPGIAIPLKTTLSQDLAFKVSPSSSVIYLTVKGYQAP